jgi:hypothetical protein
MMIIGVDYHPGASVHRVRGYGNGVSVVFNDYASR